MLSHCLRTRPLDSADEIRTLPGHKQELIILSLLHAANWVRGVLNAYHLQVCVVRCITLTAVWFVVCMCVWFVAPRRE